jgi:hypothetical protein
MRSDGVVRPIILPSHGNDQGSNPCRSILLTQLREHSERTLRNECNKGDSMYGTSECNERSAGGSNPCRSTTANEIFWD